MPSPDLSSAAGRVHICSQAMDRAHGPVPAAELADLVACSARQVQRDFAQVLGITPRQYGASVRTLAGRQALRESRSVLDALNCAGYGSVRAFYDETARRLGMSPQQYALGAPGLPLLWAGAPSPIGELVAVASAQGLCAVRIGEESDLIAEIHAEFRGAELRRDEGAMSDVMAALQRLAAGLDAPQIPINAVGTAFQARVWAALREIPAGETRTYSQVALAIGAPRSVRAVAGACASNPVAIAVPCHRVLRADGNPAGYRWGLAIKEALLTAERTNSQDLRVGNDHELQAAGLRA